MIKIINLEDQSLLEELFRLQRASYIIEAELVNFYEIPPLKESLEDLKRCGEIFIGYFENNELAGALSYTIDGEELTICRMTVHPDHFRKGIAQKLLDYLEITVPNFSITKVSTGKDNTPAKRLYLKNEFVFTGDLEVAPQFFISNFEKRKDQKNDHIYT